MKKVSKKSVLFLIIVTVLNYLPIILTVVYSFNASKITSVWSGLSLTWYEQLLNDNDIVLKTYKNYLQSLQNIEKFKISIENELFEKIEGVIYESNIDKNSPKATKIESYMGLLSNATKAIS